MALGWCLRYDVGHCYAGVGPTLSAVMRTCSWQVPVQIPAHASPPPHRQLQDPGRENRTAFPPCGLVPRRILVFLPNAGSHTLCFVLEMLPAGVALRQPGKGRMALGAVGWGECARLVGRLWEGTQAQVSSSSGPCRRQAGRRSWHTRPKAQWALGLWGCFPD